ncbi:hypothetical protein FKW77_007190 [Venturia effusa]|uniref:Uncharacterized protein n=1 Tax=Venturia effusa TaxID=50376 RepID=A0A517LPA0_9PEZI|nr:hypothetical protein FKW77_007190 [Venturia effusa]
MADPSIFLLPESANTPNRLSKHDSEIFTTRASHGSVSENQPWTENSPALGSLGEVNLAVPQLVAFYDQRRIKTSRKPSLESTPTRKSKSSTKSRAARRDKSHTWPKPEHSPPSNPATAPSNSVSATASSPEAPTISSLQSEHSPFSYEATDDLISSLTPVQNRNSTGNYLHSTLKVGNPSLVGGRSSSRRAETKIKLSDNQKTFQAPSTPSPQSIGELSSSPNPGSSGKEDATALPQYCSNQNNLEQQLNAARASQLHVPRQSKASDLATQLYTICYLIFFSIFGTLARLGLSWLTFYPGAPVVTPILWSNFGGSLLLGWLMEDRQLFREEWSSHSPAPPSLGTNAAKSRDSFPIVRQHRTHDCPDAVAQHLRVKTTIPLYIGLTVGLCGSFTSFSAFMRDAFLALSNDLPSPINHPYPMSAAPSFQVPSITSTVHRNAGYAACAVLAIVVSTMSLSLAALVLGKHIAIATHGCTPSISFTLQRKYLDRVAVFLGLGCWLGAILLTSFAPNHLQDQWRSDVLFAIVFAPLGCLARFFTSQWLNPVSPSFPLGTFVANVCGTVLEALTFSLGHIYFSGHIGGGKISCQILHGVGDGFCGTFTTVSTFVAEMQSLKRSRAYVYGAATVMGGVAMVVAVMGGIRWGVLLGGETRPD